MPSASGGPGSIERKKKKIAHLIANCRSPNRSGIYHFCPVHQPELVHGPLCRRELGNSLPVSPGGKGGDLTNTEVGAT